MSLGFEKFDSADTEHWLRIIREDAEVLFYLLAAHELLMRCDTTLFDDLGFERDHVVSEIARTVSVALDGMACRAETLTGKGQRARASLSMISKELGHAAVMARKAVSLAEGIEITISASKGGTAFELHDAMRDIDALLGTESSAHDAKATA